MKCKSCILLIILFWASSISIFSQNLQIRCDSTFQYTLGNKVFLCTKMSIVNNSIDKFIVWLDSNKKGSQEANFRNYFFRRIGDFTLYNILMEYRNTLCIDNPKAFSELFKTFYKVLAPKECFDFLFIMNDCKLETKEYIKHIKENLLNSISERELSKLNITMDEVFKQLSFKSQYIVINVDDLYNNEK